MYDVSRMDAAARLPLALFRTIDADPRHWQIIALAGLFLFSYGTSSFGAEPSALLFAFSGAMPGCIGIVAMMLLLGRDAWVSPGQWGQMPLIAGYALALAALVLSSAKRLDIALGFLGTFAAILITRALWLGDPMAIPMHQLSSGTLLVFSFFMITDPRSTPDTRAGRIILAMGVAALAAWFIIGPNQRAAPMMALAALSILTPILDRLLPARRFQWGGPHNQTEDHAYETEAPDSGGGPRPVIARA